MKSLKFLLIASYLGCFISPAVSAETFGDSFRSWLLGPEAHASTQERMEVQLDDIAQGCMQCHNGVGASHITAKNARAPLQISGSMNVNHPVGMDYDEYAFRKPRGYRSSASLDPNILLVDGKVSCVSCHQLKEKESRYTEISQLESQGNSNCSVSNQLTVGPKESDLCLSCHIK